MSEQTSNQLQKIRELELKIGSLGQELRQLQAEHSEGEVPSYEFKTVTGNVSLLELFGDKDRLLAIHNMGQACRYCTLWADGINGFLPHLESAMSVALLSKDPPNLQRSLANARQWRFQMASHGGGAYQQEQVAGDGMDNAPGVVSYRREGNKILRGASAYFGPGDNYCSMWNFLGLAGLSESDWTPQYRYWQQPRALEDGGENLL